jgi:Meiotically Up-regulated Gene 113 (MUG113) protein
MGISREEILAEIRKLVTTGNGIVPGERTFRLQTSIKESAWKGRYWARWTDAVREAGYDPNEMNQKIPDDEMLGKLGSFITNLGRFPIRDEINLQARNTPNFPVWQTVKKRYGGMPQTAAALLEYSNKTGNSALAEICHRRIQQENSKTPVKRIPSGRPTSVGYVYLKYSPSLRLYKIGKADHPDKRGAGISLLLPEDLLPKHQIKTDHPYLLEKYWHHRFKAKKQQGEWFDLNSQDVELFKKRREFMFDEFFS